MRIVAYTYEADVHCSGCTYKRFGRHTLPQHTLDSGSPPVDSHGISLSATDLDGNPPTPVFSTSEHGFTHCGTCGREL